MALRRPPSSSEAGPGARRAAGPHSSSATCCPAPPATVIVRTRTVSRLPQVHASQRTLLCRFPRPRASRPPARVGDTAGPPKGSSAGFVVLTRGGSCSRVRDGRLRSLALKLNSADGHPRRNGPSRPAARQFRRRGLFFLAHPRWGTRLGGAAARHSAERRRTIGVEVLLVAGRPWADT